MRDFSVFRRQLLDGNNQAREILTESVQCLLNAQIIFHSRQVWEGYRAYWHTLPAVYSVYIEHPKGHE